MSGLHARTAVRPPVRTPRSTPPRSWRCWSRRSPCSAVLLVRPDEAAVVDRHPTRTSLTSASIVCPSALPGASAASLATAEKGVRGTVRRDDRVRCGRGADRPSAPSPGSTAARVR